MPPVAKKEQQQERAAAEDPRGIQFGTAVVYDDFGGAVAAQEEEYVTELPTATEENAAAAAEQEEMADEGRISSHPSTRMAQRSVRTKISKRTLLAVFSVKPQTRLGFTFLIVFSIVFFKNNRNKKQVKIMIPLPDENRSRVR